MANIDISYKGQTIATINNGEEKVLKTAGKYCEDNISLQLVGEEASLDGNCVLETWDKDGSVIGVEYYGQRVIPETLHSHSNSIANTVETMVIGDGITSIGGSAFARYSKLKEVTLSETVKVLDGLAFQKCSALEKVTAKGELDYIGITVFDETPFYEALTANEENWENSLLYWGMAVMSCNKQETSSPIFKTGTRLIAGRAFSDSRMSSINIPEGVISIGDEAFFASQATEIILPSTVTILGVQLFLGSYNSSLENSILKKVVIKGPAKLPRQTFYKCSALEEADLSGATIIPSDAFDGCSNITTLTLGENLIKIDPDNSYYTFCDCKKLQTVYYKGTPESWANIDFSATSSSPGCGASGYNLYCNNVLLTELTLSKDVKPYTFAYCTSLKKVAITKNITIGEDAFAQTKIAEVEFGEDITSIPEKYFSTSNLIKVTLGSNITTLVKGAFFSFNEKQKSLYYNGTLESWCNMDFIELEGTDFEYQLGLMYMYNLYINNQKIVDLVIPDSITSIKSNSFSLNNGIETITIGDNVTNIEPMCFLYCTALKAITIGKGINQIVNLISSLEYTPLETISVSPNNDTFSAEDNILFNKEKTTLFLYPCGKAQETYITPQGVIELYSSSFANSKNLKYLTISDEVISAKNAIYNCNNLSTVVIGNNVTTLGSEPFSDCYSLTSITVNEQNQAYCSKDGVLFDKNITSLLCYPPKKPETSFIVPATITSLTRDNLFTWAENLTEVTFEGTPNSIKNYIFSSSITTINVPWAEGAVANAPWGASNATINYDYIGGES